MRACTHAAARRHEKVYLYKTRGRYALHRARKFSAAARDKKAAVTRGGVRRLYVAEEERYASASETLSIVK